MGEGEFRERVQDFGCGLQARGFEDFVKGGEGFDGEGFGAGLGVDGGLRHGGGRGCGRESGGAEVVGEGLAFLSEGLADEAEEAGFVNAEFGKARGKSPAEDGGVHVGRRREGGGRQREERLGGAVHLDGDGEQAVVARAGLRR